MRLLCVAGRHQYGEEWALRPAWVGAGISIEKVHYDRQCVRCRHTEAVWVDIEGDLTPIDETLRLSDWLKRNNAAVDRPDGTVRLPAGGTF